MSLSHKENTGGFKRKFLHHLSSVRPHDWPTYCTTAVDFVWKIESPLWQRWHQMTYCRYYLLQYLFSIQVLECSFGHSWCSVLPDKKCSLSRDTGDYSNITSLALSPLFSELLCLPHKRQMCCCYCWQLLWCMSPCPVIAYQWHLVTDWLLPDWSLTVGVEDQFPVLYLACFCFLFKKKQC